MEDGTRFWKDEDITQCAEAMEISSVAGVLGLAQAFQLAP